ncbi:MAG TPA: hypothetical protein VFA39_09015 [Steroidobacteraceae bacterium]|nr:hypothetical protein [Steroidobacteraceae bacterium]
MSLRFSRAHRHMLVSGVMKVLPNSVNEYSTPRPLDPVNFLAIIPVDCRLRSVLVSMRCEAWRNRRCSCACRCGAS